MALEDKDLLKIICEKYPDQPLEYVMEKFGQAKAMYLELERSKDAIVKTIVHAEPVQLKAIEEASATDEEVVEAPKKKRLTKRSLVCKPEEAIDNDTITCCICGRKMQTLTARHLETHGVTVEEYKKVCGYAPDQKLMSSSYAAKMADNIKAAQEAREMTRMEAQYAAEQAAAKA